jgi:hypothetical protein
LYNSISSTKPIAHEVFTLPTAENALPIRGEVAKKVLALKVIRASVIATGIFSAVYNTGLLLAPATFNHFTEGALFPLGTLPYLVINIVVIPLLGISEIISLTGQALRLCTGNTRIIKNIQKPVACSVLLGVPALSLMTSGLINQGPVFSYADFLSPSLIPLNLLICFCAIKQCLTMLKFKINVTIDPNYYRKIVLSARSKNVINDSSAIFGSSSAIFEMSELSLARAAGLTTQINPI